MAIRAIRTTGGIGAVGPAGADGAAGVGTAAPNVTATAAVFYTPYGHLAQFGFAGTITLPVSDPDYAHLVRIDVMAFDPSGNGVLVCTLSGWGGSSISYSGLVDFQPAANQTWSVEFICSNESGAASTSPYTVSGLTVSAAGLTSTAASKQSGSESLDDNQGLHATVDVVPVVTGARFPQPVTNWLDKADGEGWHNEGWETLTTVGQVASIDVFVPLDPAQTGWKIASYAGAIDLDQGPPSGFVQNTFTMPAAGACSATGVTAAQRVGAIRYKQDDAGTWRWGVTLQWQQPTLVEDVNYWFSFFTVQRGYTSAGTWIPDPTDPGDFPALYSGRKCTDSGQLSGGKSTPGAVVQFIGDEVWDIPPLYDTSGAANLYTDTRVLLYSVSYRNRDAASPLAFVLETTCWSGASSLSLVPTRQTAAIDGRNIAAHGIGRGQRKHPSSGVLETKLSGGLAFDGSGNNVADLGYTMRLDGSGQISLANLPAVFGLPSVPTAAYPAGAVILNTADNKIYRNPTGSAWLVSTSPVDLVAGAIATGVTLAASQISTGTLAAGVLYAGQINASQINAGTISVAISLTSPTITVTGTYSGFTTTVNIDTTNFVKVSNTSTGFCQILPGTIQGGTGAAGAFSLQDSTGSGTGVLWLYAPGGGAPAVVARTGASFVGSPPTIYMNSTQVLTTRQTDPGNATTSVDVITKFNSLLAALRNHGII
jgi:hypothetical protein